MFDYQLFRKSSSSLPQSSGQDKEGATDLYVLQIRQPFPLISTPCQQEWKVIDLECSKEWGIYLHTASISPFEGLNVESKSFAWFSKYNRYSADSPHLKTRCHHIPWNLQILWDYIFCPSLYEFTIAISQFWDTQQDKILLSFSNITFNPSKIPKSFIRLLELTASHQQMSYIFELYLTFPSLSFSNRNLSP